MGATIVLALLRASHALIAHMGDRRAYLLREGDLEPLTRDHSLVRLLIECGEITQKQAAHHPAQGQ
jgi:serine/threonine protein phosphatase PrpC